MRERGGTGRKEHGQAIPGGATLCERRVPLKGAAIKCLQMMIQSAGQALCKVQNGDTQIGKAE